MAYRGEDLDLRTPQTWTGTPAELVTPAELAAAQNGKRGVYRSGPMLVDETVLACCNQAYDIAVAHRGAEVRIEHLLNAMTRIDGAIAVLEGRGIRVPSLRRETAAIVAGDIPAIGGNGPVSPRRSDELADLLRIGRDCRSAECGRRRRRSAASSSRSSLGASSLRYRSQIFVAGAPSRGQRALAALDPRRSRHALFGVRRFAVRVRRETLSRRISRHADRCFAELTHRGARADGSRA